MNIKLSIEYDGRGYHGWQSQSSSPSIQSELEDKISIFFTSAAKKVSVEEYESSKNSKIKLIASGRTDAGVSACCQVANFYWADTVPFPEETFIRSINGMTSTAISVLDAEPVSEDFDSRRSVISKMYSYRISFRKVPHAIDRERILHIPGVKKSFESLETIAKTFSGTHDFNAYRSSDCAKKTSVRTIQEVTLEEKSDSSIMLYFKGNGFLKHMIRIMMGDIVRCCREEITVSEVKELLEGAKRRGASLCVEPYPLTLERVYY